MKLNRFTISLAVISLAMVYALPSTACSYEVYPPSEYMILRLDDHSRGRKSTRAANCLLWREQTTSTVSPDDIEQVVYKYSIATMKEIRTGQYKGTNAFARWLVRTNDRETIDYLILAKEYELLSELKVSPWYYPASKNDPSADSIAQRGLAYKGERMRERYALQVVRGLVAGRRYEECINYWDSIAPKLKDCVVKEMMTDYVNGAYAHIDRWEDALKYFKEKGDIESVRNIMRKHQIKPSDEVNIWEEVYRHCPTGEQLLPEVIEVAKDIDSRGTNDKKHVEKLLYFCSKVAREQKAPESATWYYLAAFFADKADKTATASQLLTQAERLNKSEYMAASLKVMRIYLDAKLATYNDAYERKLFTQLQWLDKQICDNLTEKEVKEESMRWYTNCGYSIYYWNDMLRRILLAEVCPRMLKAGRTTRALQLANMADNRIFLLCDKSKLLNNIPYKERKTLREEYADALHSFDGHFFSMADMIPTPQLAAYVRRLKEPVSAFDRFLNERNHYDIDYFNDIIGTKYLRSMQYAEAEEYLAKVSYMYQERLHVKGYFNRIPFESYKKSRYYIVDYKYNFAREMHSLEETINHTADPNRKGMLMMRFALGLQNSFTFCWALTQYGDWYSGYQAYDNDCWHDDGCTLKAKNRVRSLYSQALRMMTDRETLAKANLMLHNYKTVALFYADTETGQRIKGACDKLVDYHVNNDWGRGYRMQDEEVEE